MSKKVGGTSATLTNEEITPRAEVTSAPVQRGASLGVAPAGTRAARYWVSNPGELELESDWQVGS